MEISVYDGLNIPLLQLYVISAVTLFICNFCSLYLVHNIFLLHILQLAFSPCKGLRYAIKCNL